MQISDNTWVLIARSLSGEASFQEKEELRQILDQNPGLQQYYDIMRGVWNEKHFFEDNDAGILHDKALKIISRANESESNNHKEIYNRPLRSKRISRASFYISGLFLVMIGGYFFFKKQNAAQSLSEKQPAIIAVQNGSRSRSMLPDGTTVWLNAGSKLFYEGDFKGATREVRLEGEAFFDVTKDARHPFIVHTSGIDIKVLGTAFNVKSYPEDKTVETTLYRGLVKVFRHSDLSNAIAELRPNEKLTLLKEETVTVGAIQSSREKIPISKATAKQYNISLIDSTKKESERFETAWLYNRLEFRGDDFQELALKLDRWYNINIIFEDDAVKELSFNGSFEKETPEQAFKALQTAVPRFTYKIEGDDVYVNSSQ